MTKQKKENLILLISSAMVIVAIVVSYAHRSLVVDHRQNNTRKYNIPVVTDAVIPATGPIHQLSSAE